MTDTFVSYLAPTGPEIWSSSCGAFLSRQAGRPSSPRFRVPASSPIVAAGGGNVLGRVLIGSTSGIFYALDPITLTNLWQYPPNAEPNGPGALLGNCNPDLGGNGTFGRYGIHASASLAQIGGQNAVIFGAPDPSADSGHGSARLFALNVETGQPIWKADGVHDGSDVVAHVTGCTPCPSSDPACFALEELHERVANSSPLVFANKVYVGVHDSGDDPIQKGKVVAVDLATGKLAPFNYVSTGTPQDNQRGGGVWSALSGDGANIYFTTGNTRIPRCPWPYLNCFSLPEPSPNYGLGMVSVNKDTGSLNLNWPFQPVPFALDGDPDWSAGAAVVYASCGTVIASVMKDGWAYGINSDGSCKWQFPPTAPVPPAPGACKFPINDTNIHGDDGYRQPAAVRGDTIIIKMGLENLTDPNISAGYARVTALDVCAPDRAHRVKWITDPLVPSSSGGDVNPNCNATPSENEMALGAPTVTEGVIYVTANEGVRCDPNKPQNQAQGIGHVLAIADPTLTGLSLGPTCTNPDFPATSTFGGPPSECVAPYSIVPAAAVLADVPLPDQGDAVHLRKEPAISNGKLYVATSVNPVSLQGGHVYVIEPAAPPPRPFDISVSMTRNANGPDICINGEGFTSPGPARISYLNVPGRITPLFVDNAHVNPDGKFFEPDTNQEGTLVSCGPAQLQQNVTIEVVDKTKGTASTVVPAGYWCSNALVSTNFNGSCH